MTKASIAVVDYGLGNLFSVKRAFEFCGANNAIITNNPEIILKSDLVVLPGVGAFAEGMLGIKQSGLDGVLREFANTGKPLLGICLGMQLLATLSQEFGENEGLGLIDGTVRAIPVLSILGEQMKVPFIGWSNLKAPQKNNEGHGLLDSLDVDKSVYFVHSYQFIPRDRKNILAIYEYGGHEITAAVQKDNILGLQFHPEKSGEMGLKILKTFIASKRQDF